MSRTRHSANNSLAGAGSTTGTRSPRPHGVTPTCFPADDGDSGAGPAQGLLPSLPTRQLPPIHLHTPPQRNGAQELCESQPIATPPHRSFDGKQATLGLLDLALQLLGTWRLTIRVHRLHRSIKRPLDSARDRLCSCSVSTYSCRSRPSHRGHHAVWQKGSRDAPQASTALPLQAS
jgi:hypothetical protein